MWIELCCWLINEDELGIHGQDTSQGDEMLLATAEFPDKSVLEMFETDRLKRVARPFGVVLQTVVQWGELHIVANSFLHQLVLEVLKHIPDSRREFSHIGFPRIGAGDRDLALESPLEEVWDQAIERLAECGFAASVATHNGREFTRLDSEIRITQDRCLTTGVLECQIVNDDIVLIH